MQNRILLDLHCTWKILVFYFSHHVVLLYCQVFATLKSTQWSILSVHQVLTAICNLSFWLLIVDSHAGHSFILAPFFSFSLLIHVEYREISPTFTYGSLGWKMKHVIHGHWPILSWWVFTEWNELRRERLEREQEEPEVKKCIEPVVLVWGHIQPRCSQSVCL